MRFGAADFAKSSKILFFCGLIFAKSWAFLAALKEVVCESVLSQKADFQKVLLSPAHVEKAHVFCGHRNRLNTISLHCVQFTIACVFYYAFCHAFSTLDSMLKSRNMM